MREWSERSLSNLEGVHPDLRRVFDRALIESPLDFIVTDGLRTIEEQRKNVASGASQTMNSRHLTGHAIDIAVLVEGKVKWDWPLYDRVAVAVRVAADAEGVLIEWGGDWKMRDGPHYQLTWRAYPADDPWPVEGAPDDPARPSPSIWARIVAAILAIWRNRKEPGV